VRRAILTKKDSISRILARQQYPATRREKDEQGREGVVKEAQLDEVTSLMVGQSRREVGANERQPIARDHLSADRLLTAEVGGAGHLGVRHVIPLHRARDRHAECKGLRGQHRRIGRRARISEEQSLESYQHESVRAGGRW